MGKFFDDLLESVTQMDEMLRGERAPLREFRVDALRVREIRRATGLSQAGSARALLRAINNDPKHVLYALAR